MDDMVDHSPTLSPRVTEKRKKTRKIPKIQKKIVLDEILDHSTTLMVTEMRRTSGGLSGRS